MNAWWLAAGGVCLFTSLVHLVGGHYDPVIPFLRSDLAPVSKAVLHACWHIVTVVLFSSAAALLALGWWPETPGAPLLAGLVGAQFLGFALVFLLIPLAEGRLARLYLLPQWTLLAPIGALALLGM